MVRRSVCGHDGAMTETRQQPETDDGFDSRRLRTIADVRRSRDDRVLAGVCAGTAKYLNVDPVVIRVIIAVLTFVGLSGLILYVAAWLLLPAEDETQSIVADWFNLDKNEETVRIGGLVAAAVLAVLAIVGDNQWAWWGVPWVLLPLAALYWLFVVRPRREQEPRRKDDDPPGVADPVGTDTLVLGDSGDTASEPQKTRGKRSWALTALTVSVTAIALAITLIAAETSDGTPWTTYVAVALAVVAVGILVGTFFGHPGPLVLIGIALVVALVAGWMLPNGATGDRSVTPTSATAVDDTYEHGMGRFELDLTDVEDADQLLGSTLRIETGWGETTVIVPDDLNVGVDAEVQAGEIRAFGRKSSGTDVGLDHPPDDRGAPAVRLHIRHSLGTVEVIER